MIVFSHCLAGLESGSRLGRARGAMLGAVVCAAWGLAGLAHAAEPVTSTLSAWKVSAEGEREKLDSAKDVAPGDIVEYRVEYRNKSAKSVRDLVATLPIPRAMSYIERSTRPTRAQASTNGRTFGAVPLRRRVKGADGSTSIVAVPGSQYRFLRWSVPVLAPGQSISFAARARVNR